MSDTPAKPVLFWFRRDLRLADHPGLHAALERARANGGAVIPVFVHDREAGGLGAAPRWRLGEGLRVFAEALAEKGSRLILRQGEPLQVLRDLIDETGADCVMWQRAYAPDSIERDSDVKAALQKDGIDVESHPGHLLFEPWTVETKQGGFYKVYTPMWNMVKDRDVPEPLRAPSDLRAPDRWPDSDALDDWEMGAAMRRGAAVVAAHATVGEAAARDKFNRFLRDTIADYASGRDRMDAHGTSEMSEPLSYGEIGPRTLWHGAKGAGQGKGVETYLKELVWREFAYHLMYHTPRLLSDNWREKWDSFPWKEDRRLREVRAWEQARTGVPIVDAALREMYVTGRMHNRARMIVASYLCKHCMVHWRIGQEWFADCLIDWDPASNALGWQWTAGSGPDAAPYFRVYNPYTQAEKFDPDGSYVTAWVAEGQARPPATALAYFDAIPRAWGLSPDDPYPEPVVSHEEGRARALEAYENRDF